MFTQPIPTPVTDDNHNELTPTAASLLIAATVLLANASKKPRDCRPDRPEHHI